MGNFFKSLFSSSKAATPEEEKSKNDQKNFDILKYDGVRAQKIGQVAYAIKCFTEALKLQEDFETMTYLVAAYTTANKAEEALEVLNRMVELEPDHINTLLTRVNVLFMLDKDADVIADCRHILELEETNHLAWFLMGKAKRTTSDPLGAIADLTKAIALKEDFTDAYLMRARILLSMQQATEALPDVEKRMMQMFYITVWGKAVEDWDDEEVLSNLYALSDSAVLLGELMELLRYRFEQIDFIDEPVELGFDCPLDLHCTYTRDQLLVALDFMKPSTVREGVKWLPEKNTDVFFVTLNKADKDYSPTTMYNDYSINESLFHWQSQSTTAENSPTGQRYIHHKERGSKVLLFVREFKADRMTGGAEAYTYLGTANYVKHTGSRPMNITWQLDRPIPAKFLKKTNKLVVG